MGSDVLHPLAIDVDFAAVAQTLQIFGAGEWPTLGADGILAFDPFHEGLSLILPSRPRVKTHYPVSRVAAKIAVRAGERRGAYRQYGRAFRRTRPRFSPQPERTRF